MHLAGPTVFYLVWLSNFKLILFAFDDGPLATSPPLSLLHFTCLALLPIKSSTTSSTTSTSQLNKSTLVATKVVLLVIIIYAYDLDLHPYVRLGLYCCHVYLGVELVLAITGFPVRAILGLEIEPQFNEPYLATSLQDFWGRRWNLMVTSILRPTVYNPVLAFSSRCGLGLMWVRGPPTFATFLVSGLMHEWIFYYLTRVAPTWEVTWFFVIHGVCTAAEVVVKKAAGDRYRLPRPVSTVMTVGFVAVTGVWWFFPQILRNGVEQKAIGEYAILAKFGISKQRNINSSSDSTLFITKSKLTKFYAQKDQSSTSVVVTVSYKYCRFPRKWRRYRSTVITGLCKMLNAV
ncbi:hypothetical protein ACET3Z_017891 [Daucus carota]